MYISNHRFSRLARFGRSKMANFYRGRLRATSLSKRRR